MRNNIIRFVGLLTLVLSTFYFTACGEADGSDVKINAASKDESRGTAVETQILKSTEFADHIKIIGQLKPFEKSSLSHQTGGIISEFVIDKGENAQKGDTIAILDNDVLKANVAAAKAQYDLAQITYEKQELIFKDNVNSEIQVLEAKLNRDVAKANYELVKAQLDDTYIVAGFSGVVDSKYFEVGELAGPGMPIVNLINISKIKIEAGVPEKHVGKVKKGAPVKIYVKSYSEEPIVGTVSYIGNSVSVNNRTLPIEILITNKNNSLKPELVAELYIQNKMYDNVILVPEEVVSRVDNGYEVFVENDGKAESRIITIINRFEDKIAVGSGLEEGEKLIVVGYQNLVNGQNVKVDN